MTKDSIAELQEAEKKAKEDMAKALEEKNEIIREAHAKSEKIVKEAHDKASMIKEEAEREFSKKAETSRRKALADATAKAAKIKKTSLSAKKSAEIVKAIIKGIVGK